MNSRIEIQDFLFLIELQLQSMELGPSALHAYANYWVLMYTNSIYQHLVHSFLFISDSSSPEIGWEFLTSQALRQCVPDSNRSLGEKVTHQMLSKPLTLSSKPMASILWNTCFGEAIMLSALYVPHHFVRLC